MLLNIHKIAIMSEFLGNYKVTLTGSFIAEKNKLNQKSVSNFLRESEEEGVLKSSRQGKNRLYTLNLENSPLIIDYISSIEHLRTIGFYKRHSLIKEISEKILPYCNGITVIFGSYAKGTEKKDSDLDVFVAGSCNKNKIEETSKIYNLEVNLKIYPLSLFKKALKQKDPFVEEIINNHIVIKNIQEFVYLLKKFRYGKD